MILRLRYDITFSHSSNKSNKSFIIQMNTTLEFIQFYVDWTLYNM